MSRPDAPPPPPHRQPRLLLLVLLGGLVGAPLRHVVGLGVPTGSGDLPWATFGVNVVGAFALGALLTGLERAGDDTGTRRELRLALGAGLLGAFTTYSALGAETAVLLRDGQVGLAAGYALGSAVTGVLAAAAGIAVGAALARDRTTT